MELNKDIADISAAEAENFKGKRFILCYHDYNIKNFESALVQIDKITKVAGSPISIAVVPAIGAAPEEERERFCESIEKLKSEGHELLLHGARHAANLSKERSVFGKSALMFSNNVAEFAGLNEEESQALLDRSIALWHALGQEELPIGYVPPAWYDNNYLKDQILAKFKTYEDRTTIYKKSDLIVSVNDDEEVETNAEPVAENEKEPSSKEDNTEKFLSFGISFAGLPDISLGVAQTSACLTIQAPIGTPRLTIHHVDFTSIGETRVMNLIRYALSKREKIFYRDL
ncbi:MAG: DUF2334 domain-containing protein [Fibrobacter sp.]|nr:DUF2334 domain-containing protein [Fibrobacter sp.]MDY6368578.1 DUF2334 domain-containing protein [Fibrobacter sp.]MDY6388764.1 DUF2334 domain-containing protein [Fibrobacter sp.]